MRRFTLGSVTDRKIVVIELQGTVMKVVQMMPDGSSKRSEKELKSEAEARSASERMASELIARGFVEQVARDSKPVKPPRPAAPASKPAAQSPEREEPVAGYLLDDVEEYAAPAQPVLSRLAVAPVAQPASESAPKKKKKPGKKKKQAANGDALDKRVLGGVAAVGALLLAGLGYVIYDGFLKPPTIVGTWRGSMTEYETGKMIIHTKYDLILDKQKRASMTLQQKLTSIGTYSVKGNRLKLTLKDDDGETSEQEYKFALARSTLDLIDPATDKLAVQLIRFQDPPLVGKTPAPAAGESKELAAPEIGTADPEADARLASVELAPKDGAFKLRYPQGWVPDSGSRPDNTWSWVKVTKDSALLQVYADMKGSVMSGSDSAGQFEEGSELAPVHRAHEFYKKTAAEELADYAESKPALFKGSTLGEGRISVFTASGGGLFGSKLRGYHVTLLTKDRRVSILCHCPEKEFAKFKPAFLAVCRSVSR